MKTKMINGKLGYFIGTEVEEDTNAVYHNWFIPGWGKGYELTEEQDDWCWDNLEGYVLMDYGTVYSETVSSDYEDESFTEADWEE